MKQMFAPYKVILESGIRLLLVLESGIKTAESGIQVFEESRIQSPVIQESVVLISKKRIISIICCKLLFIIFLCSARKYVKIPSISWPHDMKRMELEKLFTAS